MSFKNGVSITTLVLVCIAMLSLGSGLLNWNYHGTVVKQLDRIETRKSIVITNSWVSGGDTVTVTSTQGEHNPEETFGELLIRHARDVADAKVAFPVD